VATEERYGPLLAVRVIVICSSLDYGSLFVWKGVKGGLNGRP